METQSSAQTATTDRRSEREELPPEVSKLLARGGGSIYSGRGHIGAESRYTHTLLSPIRHFKYAGSQLLLSSVLVTAGRYRPPDLRTPNIPRAGRRRWS